MPQELNIFVKIVNVKTFLRDVAKKTRENVGILKKTGGGLPESHFHFLLFFTWETPQKKVLKCKINHNFFKKKNMSFPNRGKGGGPPLGKNSHIFLFFLLLRTSLRHNLKSIICGATSITTKINREFPNIGLNILLFNIPISNQPISFSSRWRYTYYVSRERGEGGYGKC